jgi:N-acetylmuramoyl-L-alanine amidase
VEAPPAAAPHVAESKPATEAPRVVAPRVAESKPAAETKSAPAVALAAQRDSHGDRSMIRALGLKLGRVVLDPGHGGQDAGTIGPGGLEEKTLVLDVAQRLGVLITQRLGSEVVFTRTDDTYVPLEARTALANEKRADLFLSIHANSSKLRGISGSEAYFLNFTTSASALEVAARENASSEQSIHELQSLLQKIALKEKVQESREFAATIQRSLYAGLWDAKGIKNRGVKQAPFVVLIGAQMPSVLAEIAFLSNPKDEAQLKRPEYRQKVAEALYKGVSQYAGTLSHFQVARGKGAEGQQ